MGEFAQLDSLQMILNHSEAFDVVIEKGGVSDIYKDKPGGQAAIVQLLTCIASRAFLGKGGVFISMGFTSPPWSEDNLEAAVKVASELNCHLQKIVPIGNKYDKTGGRLVVFTTVCRAVRLAKLKGRC